MEFTSLPLVLSILPKFLPVSHGTPIFINDFCLKHVFEVMTGFNQSREKQSSHEFGYLFLLFEIFSTGAIKRHVSSKLRDWFTVASREIGFLWHQLWLGPPIKCILIFGQYLALLPFVQTILLEKLVISIKVAIFP